MYFNESSYTADARFAKVYDAVDWRRKDYYGQIVRENVEFKLNHNAILAIGVKIHQWISERVDECELGVDLFANFVSFLVKKKVDGQLAQYAELKLPLGLIIVLECIGLWFRFNFGD